ncbi:nitroreductase/quinone reductase family protein [Nocardia niigatensis]
MRSARPEIIEDPEYQQIWDALTADRAFYRDYQSRTERRIPLVRLREL